MKPILSFLLMLCHPLLANAQYNMVPNGDFEDYIDCPSSLSQIMRCVGWQEILGTPDFYHLCATNNDVSVPANFFGSQSPTSGDAYAGFYDYIPNKPDRREYIGRTITPLQPGVKYEVSVSIALGNLCSYASNGFGIFFHKDGNPSYTGQILTVSPQVSFSSMGPFTNKDKWQRLSYVYVPDSAYDKIIIGGFKNDNSLTTSTVGGTYPSAYYYIDSLVIAEPGTRPPLHPTDTNYTYIQRCQGESISMYYQYRETITFAPDNIFYLQLSSSNGNFNSFINIDSIMSTSSSGTITGSIPVGISNGSGYRIRVVAKKPYLPYYNKQIYTINTLPVIAANATTTFCPGNNIMLFAKGGSEFIWTGPNNFQSSEQNPVIRHTSENNAGKYMVSGKLDNCLGSDTVSVSMACGIIDIPTAFSPNGDGKNDLLFAVGNEEIVEMRLNIYNRWGQNVFTTSHIKNGWDGTYKGSKLAPDVFGYVLFAKFRDGTTSSKKGNITLLK